MHDRCSKTETFCLFDMKHALTFLCWPTSVETEQQVYEGEERAEATWGNARAEKINFFYSRTRYVPLIL